MTNEALFAIDTAKMTEEEARLAGIEILRDEIASEKRALPYLYVFMFFVMLIAFCVALLTGRAEGLIVGFLLGMIECCFELNHDERKRLRKYKKELLPAFESGTYEGSYITFVRDFQEEADRKRKELQKYMKKRDDGDFKE